MGLLDCDSAVERKQHETLVWHRGNALILVAEHRYQAIVSAIVEVIDEYTNP